MIARHPVKVLVVVLMLLAAGLGWSYVTRDSIPVPSTKEPAAGEVLVVAGLGGISWDDVSAADTPVLWGLLRDGAAASVSVKTLHLTTCPTDGWATLSAGQAAGPEAEGARPLCGELPKVEGAAKDGYRIVGFDSIKTASHEAAFRADLGMLGDSFAADKTCLMAIGPGAALGAARSDGTLERYVPFQTKTLTSDLAQCPVSLVDLGGLAETSESSAVQVERLNVIERRISQVIDAMPTGADLLVVGLSDRDRVERLRVLTATGPHYAPGFLSSASTRQKGIAQISDVTATILQRGGVIPTRSIGGRALAANPSPNNSEATAASKLTELTDVDTKADAMHRIVVPFLAAWLGTVALAYLVLCVFWRSARRGRGRLSRHQVLRSVRWVSLVAAAMPAATFLANLIPWWRWSTTAWVLVGLLGLLVLGLSCGLASLSLNGPWSSSALGPLAAMSAMSAGVIGIDLLTGSHLQMSSIFGLQPLVGGRFYGMGNVAFALYGAAVLLLVASLAHALVRRGAARLAVFSVLAMGGIALAVDVLPAWGADFGGPIALVPALGFVLMAVAGIRVSAGNLALVALAAALVVTLVCYLDWRRPEATRSHPGRFLQTLIDGDAWPVVSRKFLANVQLAADQPVVLGLSVLLFIVASFVVLRPGLVGTGSFARLVDEAPLLRSGLLGLIGLCLIGFLTNDSGAAIPPVALIFTVPVVLSAVAHFVSIERRAAPVTSRRDRHLL